MMNTAFVWVSLWPFNVLALGTIVKRLGWYVSDMPETIPLCTGLRVELIFVIICNVFKQCLGFVLEDLPAKCRHVGDVQWQVQRNNVSRFDFFSSRSNTGWSEEVDSSYLQFILTTCQCQLLFW
jgi:hypothetical protein